ncbi:GAF domain-containing protein [Sphingomonas sp. 8AM]|uniref:GAF domain-containing protein n=1 Tax=Sphingomonas sp. 8AM TaxID=2653170 RepID=UPI0012F29576|nr:GAF domain-containing protein [Sphingomonas sp. 8AM]VXD00108.1 Sensory box histidine kinase/response regulator [Sphingomonas sp. 8AM]
MLKTLLEERKRSRAVRDLKVVGSAAEPVFDRFVAAAAAAFNAPVALISLIHGEEQWFKAAHGLVIDCIPRADGFCGHALDCPDVLEVLDPCADPRFAQLPNVVGDPYVRYYIGARLQRTDGTSVGALCVVDTRARTAASADQKAYLSSLARQVTRALEDRMERRIPEAAR